MSITEKVLQEEVEKLQRQLIKKDKVIKSLRERVQRGIQNTGDSFAVFERNIRLQEMIDEKTQSLKAAVEKAESSNRAKSKFLANMSHELRTPLHAIISFSDFGQKDLAKEKFTRLDKYFNNIHVSGKKLLLLLNDLLDLSKLEADKFFLDCRKIDMQNIVDVILTEQQSVLDEKNLTVKIITPECETHAFVDAIRIEQVVRNIITNAIKFTENGKVISISYASCFHYADKQEPIPALEIAIADQGVGIPDDELEAVFDKFIQSSKTRSQAGGTGLGLAICKNIVEIHKGQMWAEQNPEGGSIFKFSVPLNEDFSSESEETSDQDSNIKEVEFT